MTTCNFKIKLLAMKMQNTNNTIGKLEKNHKLKDKPDMK